jgi:hypothetical protein
MVAAEVLKWSVKLTLPSTPGLSTSTGFRSKPEVIPLAVRWYLRFRLFC